MTATLLQLEALTRSDGRVALVLDDRIVAHVDGAALNGHAPPAPPPAARVRGSLTKSGPRRPGKKRPGKSKAAKVARALADSADVDGVAITPEEAKRLVREGASIAEMARRSGVSYQTLWNVANKAKATKKAAAKSAGAGPMRRCEYCSARMPVDATACPNGHKV